jgi:hypothetical protein
MKWLEEETENFKKTIFDKNINPHIYSVVLNYAFFSEENYQGEKSHQEAAIEMIKALNIQYCKRVDSVFTEEHEKRYGKEYTTSQRKKYAEKRPSREIRYTNDIYFYSPNDISSFKKAVGEPYAVNLELMNAREITSKHFFHVDENPHMIDTDNYADAFLHPPYSYLGTSEDFIRVNDYLFPKQENLTIYQWDNDWSDYFGYGKEWWGAAMWTVYDPNRKRFTVIGASATD